MVIDNKENQNRKSGNHKENKIVTSFPNWSRLVTSFFLLLLLQPTEAYGFLTLL